VVLVEAPRASWAAGSEVPKGAGQGNQRTVLASLVEDMLATNLDFDILDKPSRQSVLYRTNLDLADGAARARNLSSAHKRAQVLHRLFWAPTSEEDGA
jgi:hypothetical protein